MTLRKSVLIALLLSVIATPALAQNRAKADPEAFKGLMGAMMKAMFSVLSDPEMGESMAKFYRNFHDSLVAQGFTKEQAMKIVTSTPLPLNK